ncbi:VapE domain-containing protein [Bradyrhizobium uaiense]|nr:VapE domain-containing protein [Bradyrhizobium uaiense]
MHQSADFFKLRAIPIGKISLAVFDSGQSYDQAYAYIAALVQGDPNAAIIDTRCIHDVRKDLPAIPRRGTLPALWSELCKWNNDGYGVFVCISEMDGNGREIANVKTIRCQAIDLDNLSAQQNYERAAQFNPPPSFAVQSSPNKFHCYWVTQQHTDRDKFTLLQCKLRVWFDGDKKVIDSSRVLRVPGFYHLKDPNNPHLVTCWGLSGYGKPIDPAMLEIALAGVTVIDTSGGRHPLGEASLQAPSLDFAIRALNAIDPNTLDRDNWISVTSAFKQAAWNFAPETQLFDEWSRWSIQYTLEDGTKPTPAYLRKNWLSIRETEIGWQSFERRVPHIHAEIVFGERKADTLPTTPPMPHEQQQSQAPRVLDGYENVISTVTNDNGKNTLIETVRMLHNNLPIAFDEFTQTISAINELAWDKTSSYPRQWTETDTIHCQLYVQACSIKPGKDTVHDAVRIIADKHKKHQVRDYLNALQWDGIERLPLLATRYFGTEQTLYTCAVGVKFMIGAVARIMKPGCKMDNAVILEGAQGKLKSSSIAALAGSDWFTDELPDLQTKDAAIQLTGKWIIEVSELSALKRSDVETIKKFMSRSNDRYRAPYEKIASDHLRQSVFVATTNDEQYLKDQTGNRRFWPLACGTIDVEAIKRDRDQLWAEALARYRNGERWWFDASEEHLARAEQEQRREVDPWQEKITSYVEALNGLPTTIETICFLLNIPFERQNSIINKRIATCLNHAEYFRKQIRYGDDKRAWRYVKTKTAH